MHEILQKEDVVSRLFAVAPSQKESLHQLCRVTHVIDWSLVNAFYFDEYIGLAVGTPQSFGTFLREHIVDRVKPGTVHYMNGNVVDLQAESERHAKLLEEYPLDIACIGVG
jgi:glucosamine-6-phosphate deaminase